MKILCFIDCLGSGGAQRQLVSLAVGFKERGHDVSFLVYHKVNFFKEILDDNEIPVMEITELNYLKRIHKIRLYIRKFNMDVVLSFLQTPSFIAELSGLPYRNWKLIVSERSSNPMIERSMKMKMLRWFHVFSDYIVANSYSNLEILSKIAPFINKKKKHVIYNMVDMSLWKPDVLNVNMGQQSSLFILTIAASHQYLKNLNNLVEALRLLPQSDLNRIKIHWYGNGIEPPYFDSSFTNAKKIIELYKLENIIIFYAATKELSQKFQESNAIGLFSFYEGLPNAICEGMASSKPVLCSKISDMPLLIQDERLLCDPYDPLSIANSLHYLLSLSIDELEYIGNNNYQIAKKYFNKDRIIDRYLELLV